MSVPFKRWLMSAVIIFLLGSVSTALLLYQANASMSQIVDVNQAELIKVDRGQHAQGLVRKLAIEGQIDHSIWLKLAFRLDPAVTDIKAGTYEIVPNQTLRQVLTMMVNGNEKTFSISLIEGLRWKDWYETLQRTPLLVASDKNDQQWLTFLGISDQDRSVASIEGWLMPDSYHFTAGTSVEDVVVRAYRAMQQYLDDQWHQRALNLPYETPYEVLIMASIVEKETAVPSERPHIAGVFVNRLRKNMRLQTDPTVIYGMGEAFDGNIRRKDLRQKTPYNTYVIKGLPPTPIAMPGREAIHAALHPLETEDLYFVAKGDGSHKFSQTLEQHNRAVRQYQLNQ